MKKKASAGFSENAGAQLVYLRKCKLCGKTFSMKYPDDWVYKEGRKHHGWVYFCTYRCFRQWQREKEEKKVSHGTVTG